MFPTVSQSKFAQPNWKEHFAEVKNLSLLNRGDASASEVLAATDEADVISPSERLRALTLAAPSERSKAAPNVEEREEPARAGSLNPSPIYEEPKAAASVFAALASEAVRVAADPEAKRAEAAARADHREGNNSEGVAVSWMDAGVKAARLVRENVEVTLPNGEVREYRSVFDAFTLLRLPINKHIRFRQKLKELRRADFEDAGTVYLFRIVPRSA